MRSVHLKFFSFVRVSQIVGFLPPPGRLRFRHGGSWSIRVFNLPRLQSERCPAMPELQKESTGDYSSPDCFAR